MAQGLEQQQDHRTGLARARATDQHQSAVLQPGIDLVVQPADQA
jgi:hypothetical protein